MAKKSYMFFFHGAGPEGLSPEKIQQIWGEWVAWVDKLRNKGVYKGGEALEGGGKVLSHRNGKIEVDGPFTESKELVGGYFIVEAKNLDEAVDLAKDYPDFARNGTVEVREVAVRPEPK